MCTSCPIWAGRPADEGHRRAGRCCSSERPKSAIGGGEDREDRDLGCTAARIKAAPNPRILAERTPVTPNERTLADGTRRPPTTAG